MSLKFLHHLFFPNDSNNHRPKILHYQFLVCCIIFFLAAQLILVKAKANFSQVLGATTDISVEQLLLLTNEQRHDKGLSPLALNEQLIRAAQLKGSYMLEKNYWAHNAPDGTTPWKFIKEVEYEYVYAGENLARGFTKSPDIIRAWMDSPTHRENILSSNYSDIGFAVLEGDLLGEHTTLVVEMFGNTKPVELAQKPQESVPVEAGLKLAGERVEVLAEIKNTPLIDTPSLAWYIGVGTVAFFIFILTIDMILIEKRKIVRFVGHNIDHITFLSLVLVFIILVNRGAIL